MKAPQKHEHFFSLPQIYRKLSIVGLHQDTRRQCSSSNEQKMLKEAQIKNDG